jgi:hypothetical protein
MWLAFLKTVIVWKKGLFDPFQRGSRIHYQVGDVKYETTIAQLNFFMWAIQYGVIDWAARHRDEIKKHHQEIKDVRRALIKDQPNRVKKRMRLTPVDNSHCLVYVQPMQINLGKKRVKLLSEDAPIN